MEFVRERLPRYNDENVFNDFINNGYYEIINYSELGNKFVLNNYYLIIDLIKKNEYFICSISPSNIKNDYRFYLASFERGNVDSIFFYKGDIHIFDEFFEKNRNLINSFDWLNVKIKLKKILDFNSVITDIYFEDLNRKILDGSIGLDVLIKNPYYNRIVDFLSLDSIKKMYGSNSLEFVSRYGRKILLNEDYKYIENLEINDLNKFFEIFKFKNGSIINLYNLYSSLVDYNFLYKCTGDVLNNQTYNHLCINLFSGKNIDYIFLLFEEINKYLNDFEKNKICSKYNVDFQSLPLLFDKFINLYKSENYNDFNIYSSIIKDLCLMSYNKKRDSFIKEKHDFSNGFPFDIQLTLKMKRLINKRKLMKDMAISIAYDKEKLDSLKEYLVNKKIIDKDFDSNILFALLTDGVKGVKLIEIENVNYLMGKILGFVSSYIDDDCLNSDIKFDEYKNLPLNDDCFYVPFDKNDLIDIVNSIDLKFFFETVIKNKHVFELFNNYIVKHDLIYFVSSLKLCDVCYCGDVCYSIVGMKELINNFAKVINTNVDKKLYISIFEMLKKAHFVNNPLNIYETVFGDSNKWIISDPLPHKSSLEPEKKIKRCMDVYKKMLVRDYIGVPVFTMNYGDLIVTNDNFYDDGMLVTGEKLGSCMRAGGTLDNLFEYTLTSPNGFNIIFKKDGELISRVAGVIIKNSIFLNELREPLCNDYSNDYLFNALKKYILNLVKKANLNGQIIDQVFVVNGVQGTRNINSNIVRDDLFLKLKNGYYGFNMNYEKTGLCLYMNENKALKNNYNCSFCSINGNTKYYKISKFKTLRGSDAVKRINMLRFLKGSLDYIDSFDDAICSSCFYVYKKDGIIYSDILDEVISDEIKCEYENAINSLNFRKNI